MAATIEEVYDWLRYLDKKSLVAIDDGGLQLVELEIISDDELHLTGRYFEIGGIPDPVEDTERHPPACPCADCIDADLTVRND